MAELAALERQPVASSREPAANGQYPVDSQSPVGGEGAVLAPVVPSLIGDHGTIVRQAGIIIGKLGRRILGCVFSGLRGKWAMRGLRGGPWRRAAGSGREDGAAPARVLRPVTGRSICNNAVHRSKKGADLQLIEW